MNSMKMMVCPHDTSNNPDRWYRFAQYLSKPFPEIQIPFDISLDFEDFHSSFHSADLVYANPTDMLTLLDQHSFTPIARPANLHDEVIFVASHDIDNPSLESLQGATIATVSNLLPTKIALHVLAEKNITPGELLNRESWLAVMSTIWRGEASFGFIYKDTYEELSEQGKGLAKPFFVSDEQVAFHSFNVSGATSSIQAELTSLVLGMTNDPEGQEVLGELGITQWVPVSAEEISTIRRIATSYS